MEKETNAMQELSDAEIEQVSGAGVVADTFEGVFRTISSWAGGSTLQGGLMGGIRG